MIWGSQSVKLCIVSRLVISKPAKLRTAFAVWDRLPSYSVSFYGYCHSYIWYKIRGKNTWAFVWASPKALPKGIEEIRIDATPACAIDIGHRSTDDERLYSHKREFTFVYKRYKYVSNIRSYRPWIITQSSSSYLAKGKRGSGKNRGNSRNDWIRCHKVENDYWEFVWTVPTVC